MNVDYIIVGCGLAGIAFAETCIQNGKSIIVFNNESQTSSLVAAGLYNPVILKRFSQVWHASEQIKLIDDFYAILELKLNNQFDFKTPIYRKFFSVEDVNNWFEATDKPKVGEFLSPEIINLESESIGAPFGVGKVLETGFVDTRLLVSKYIDFLRNENFYKNETFDYSQLIQNEVGVSYKEISAKHIVFAEGFGNNLNPFFNYLPVDGTKGELLLIRAPNLRLSEIINSAIYLIPIGNDLYKVGATYNWDDKTNIPTEIGKAELLLNLRKLISCDFEIIEHRAGVRPTIKDRRPLVGSHPNFKNFHILNGLGTRGVMLAPELACILFNHIEKKLPLEDYVDIKRFEKLMK